jgi:hypothetical protein
MATSVRTFLTSCGAQAAEISLRRDLLGAFVDDQPRSVRSHLLRYRLPFGESVGWTVGQGNWDDPIAGHGKGGWKGLSTDPIDAVVLMQQRACFFKGDEYVKYDVVSGMVVPTYPRKIADGWPRLWTQDIDAAVLWNNGKIYFFKGNQYMRYDVASAKVDPDYPRSISLNWQGLWPGDIDAAVLWNNGKAYFFKGAKYVRYDVASGKLDPHYPRSIAENWRGLWPGDIDAAVLWNNGKAHFFKGNSWMQFDVVTEKVDDGFPQALELYARGRPPAEGRLDQARARGTSFCSSRGSPWGDTFTE